MTQATFRQRTLHVSQCLTVINQVGLLHQLLQGLRHGLCALHINFMTEPLGEGDELRQFFVSGDEDLVRQEVKAVECLDDCVEIGRFQSQDIAQFLKFGQSC